jgi:hypothetical protein
MSLRGVLDRVGVLPDQERCDPVIDGSQLVAHFEVGDEAS